MDQNKNEDRENKITHKLGTFFSITIIACATACVIALTAKFIWWILFSI